MVLLWCMLVTPELWKLIQEDHRFDEKFWTHCKIWTMKQDLDSKDGGKIFSSKYLKKARE